MAIDNYAIADQFSLLSKLMDIHGENSFKTKSYSIAAFTIEKLPEQLSEMPPEKIFSIKGIGENIGKKIIDLIASQELSLLTEFIQKTPPGVIEMLNIKGIGPKKIATIWKEMEIESIGELLYACNENRLLLYKGFGEKTQKNVKETIEFYFKSKGSFLYEQAETYAMAIHQALIKEFISDKFEITGDFRQQAEIINNLSWITTADRDRLAGFFEAIQFKTEVDEDQNLTCHGPEGPPILFQCVEEGSFYIKLFETSSSEAFLNAWKKLDGWNPKGAFPSEEAIFSSVHLNFIPAYLREQESILEQAKRRQLPEVIQEADIRAIIHCHSNWSDGSNSIEEMAKASMDKGYEYMVISDHSKSAFYANGLNEERIKQQHLQVDELNQKMAPFKIFKSIECDILNDGSLDYSDEILSTFDLVIASIHSNLKMSEDKAMQRLLTAIRNPYTTILGHMTGRLLLSRPGYPVDHKRVIEECAANHVAIELNAHPRRLDIDWRWIEYALEKGVVISIDPDSHATNGFGDVKYGVLVAQKAQLYKEKNLSSFSLPAFQQYLEGVRKVKGL